MRFDPADGSKPTQSTVKTGTLATPPEQNPQREGFRFDGWTLDGQPYDFQTPILRDTSLKAQWTKVTDWTLSPDHGPATGAQLTISPPDRQEPQFASIQAAGNQVIGLTGDGRIYTWTQDGTPKQVPSPAQAPHGFYYLQVSAGSHQQAAVGSDQQTYTWAGRQETPTILDTSKNTRFSSISISDKQLLTLDWQGQIHALQYSQTNSQNQNPKLIRQTATSLPGQRQAVIAVGSDSRVLIVDADGQAWTWDASNTVKVKPERIRQEPNMRIIQAQALNRGFLFLDSNGQAYYLADGKNSLTAVSLPDSEQIGRINSSGDQATIIDKDSHVWAWKPGETPVRSDDGSRQYMQAVKAGSRVTAISRQGSMFAWSLDGQGRPGKPARLDTTAAPILETASMDSQPLKLTKNNNSWQTGMPAHKPGPAAITITGRQDGQPFTRSLKYTVDQTLTRSAEPRSTLTVRFDTDGGKPEPTDQSFPTLNGKVKRPSPDPSRQGFLFDGWFIGQVAYDFSKPVTKNITLTAHWSPESRNTKWSISPDKGSQLGRESTTITPPDSTNRGIRFNQVSAGISHSLALGSDGNAYAWGNNNYGQLGNGTRTQRNTPVRVEKPKGAPVDFTYLQVSAGISHSLALGSDGNAYAWGNNNYGQLGNGTSTSYRSTPVRVEKPKGAPADFTYAQISAGQSYSLAMGSDGHAYAWGTNNRGQLGDGTTTDRSTPVKVGKPAGKLADFTYVQVSAGALHSLALGSDGYAYAWGYNGVYGRLGNDNANGSSVSSYSSVPVRVRDPASPTNASKGIQATQVSAGGDHSLAVGSDGYAYAWGLNDSGQLGNNTASSSPVPVRVRDPSSPTITSKGLKAIQVSAGGSHSLAEGSDGNAYAWGNNTYGQIGNNTTGSSYVPVRVRDPASPKDTSKGLQAAQVSAGGDHSLAVGSDGNAWAWGNNGYGRLGDGSTDSKSVPVPVSFNLALVITGVRFDQTPASGLTRGDAGSVSVTTPAHAPGTVTVSVDYTLGGAPQTPDTSLRYTYLPAGVLPKAGGEGILLALATGMTGMGGVLASRRHRQETRRLVHASPE